MPHALVIGGGVIGLTSAWTLADHGFEVTVLAKEYASHEHPTISSQIGGAALWQWPPAAYAGFHHTEKQSHANSKRWCTVSYKRYMDLEGMADGVKLQMANFLFLRKVEDCQVHKQMMEEIEASSCVQSFHHDAKIIDELGLHSEYAIEDAYQYRAPVIDTDAYMLWLTSFIRQHSRVRQVLIRTISGDLLEQEELLLRKFRADVIVNATGLGSQELANDPTVYPLRGAHLRVINDRLHSLRTLHQAVLLSLDGGSEESATSDMISIIPHKDTMLILGGMQAEPNQWKLDINMENHVPLREMYNRNLALYPPLQAAELDPDYPIAVGLMPFREGNARVERESRRIGSRIIHSYGQGEAGFSLSFGCAEDVATIAESIVKEVQDQNKLPSLLSLFLIILANFLFNVSFYVIIPTASEYTKSLGGGNLFSGLVIGGVTFTSTILLIPLSKFRIFRSRYRPTLDLAASSLCIGNILYAIADRANFLYLILIGRLINGLGFTGWFFVKRYCTDVRFVGLRRRTMCSGLLVAAQTLGMVVGPILGSLLGSIHVDTRLINSNTLPGWVMAGTWFVYWILVRAFFQEDPASMSRINAVNYVASTDKESPPDPVVHDRHESLTYRIVFVAATMCYNAYTIFFELGAWESQMPLFAKKSFGWSESGAGFFIGLIGLGSFLFIFPLPFATRRIQDRMVLGFGFLIGGLGLLIHLVFLSKSAVSKASYGISWFLICWGFNLASTITLSLVSKVLPNRYSDKAALAIQLSNYMGRFTGAIWGTAGSTIGDKAIIALELGLAVLACLLFSKLWRVMLVLKG